MLSCKKATELIEKKLYFKLTKVESMQLVLHKSICSACTAYEVQSKMIDNVLKNKFSRHEIFHIEHTSEEFKQNLIKKNKK